MNPLSNFLCKDLALNHSSPSLPILGGYYMGKDEELKEAEQDWSSFGIINSSLLLQKWTQEGLISIDEDKSKLTSVNNEDYLKEAGNENQSNSQIKSKVYKKDHSITELANEILKGDQQCVFNFNKNTQVSHKLETHKKRERADAKIKKALRFTKNYIKKLFKSMNPMIAHKRYVNCSAMKIFGRMKLTLSSILSEDLLADDLVYYTIGILGLKKSSHLNCKQKIKREISDFLGTNRTFTYKKLKKTLQSSSFRVLCRYMISQADETIVESLEQVLDLE
ncbi:unnamed protein product [Moneuplotes crassus]|uniref:Uncharacterized protein n=1 Tax=Euplotes crassus TaxID=5936 RepID=A0AAD1U4H8_EUPCR|nr:unnamed protein product [Moneuplotes crassus]